MPSPYLSYSMCHLSQLSHATKFYANKLTCIHYLCHCEMIMMYINLWREKFKRIINKHTKKTTSDSVQINYELYACLVEWHKFHSFFETRASFENTNLCTYLDHLRRLMLNQTFTFNYWKTVSILIHFHQWEKIAKIEAFQVDIIHFFLSLKILPFFSHLIFFAFKFFPS